MRRRRGQGLVEFALVSVLLFVALCAILEFSWVFYNLSYLNNAVSKGARMAVVGGTNVQIWTALQSEQGGMTIATYSVTVFNPDWTVNADNTVRTKGGFVRVAATINYPSITILNRLIQMAGFATLRSECTVRVE